MKAITTATTEDRKSINKERKKIIRLGLTPKFAVFCHESVEIGWMDGLRLATACGNSKTTERESEKEKEKERE